MQRDTLLQFIAMFDKAFSFLSTPWSLAKRNYKHVRSGRLRELVRGWTSCSLAVPPQRKASLNWLASLMGIRMLGKLWVRWYLADEVWKLWASNYPDFGQREGQMLGSGLGKRFLWEMLSTFIPHVSGLHSENPYTLTIVHEFIFVVIVIKHSTTYMIGKHSLPSSIFKHIYVI